ncbi:seven-hairpin glycosidase [Martensiomyces pterosporus]|nr:seven-hairpin glycosidase [Martensiomyces pterosporus]
MRIQLLAALTLGCVPAFALEWPASFRSEAAATARPVGGMFNRNGHPPNIERANILRKRYVQHDFSTESTEDRQIRRSRAQAIKDGFIYAWEGYKKYAYGSDEIDVLGKIPRTTRNGWGATLVDALDTLWIMGLKDEFWMARNFVANIDFRKDGGQLTKVFETNIRYVGGLLSAYELSEDSVFLQKAVELADILMPAFNTPLGLPWQMLNVTTGAGSSETPGKSSTNLAEIGTFQMEFFRLSQLTKNATYHEAAQNVITVMLNNNSPQDPRSNYVIPGLYPIEFDMLTGKFLSKTTYWGGGGDSFYEYLAKTWILSDFMLERNIDMWSESIQAFKHYSVAESSDGFLFPGFVDGTKFYPYTDTFTNFIPGTLGLISRIVGSDTYFGLAENLMEAGYSVFDRMPSSLGAESIKFVRKNVPSDFLAMTPQSQDEVNKFGFSLERPYYMLRPELLESLFYMYRLTGKVMYADRVWKVWQGIQRNCRVADGYVGTANVSADASVTGIYNSVDSTESFFFAETFLYLYLTFADQDTISLDQWVFTTEAHPLSRKYIFDGTF